MKKNWIIRCGVPIHVLNYEKKTNGHVVPVKKITCENFNGYEIDFFINDHASG